METVQNSRLVIASLNYWIVSGTNILRNIQLSTCILQLNIIEYPFCTIAEPTSSVMLFGRLLRMLQWISLKSKN